MPVFGIFKTVLACLFVASALVGCGGGGDEDEGAPSSLSANSRGAVDVGGVAVAPEHSCSVPQFAPALVAAMNEARAKGQTCGTEVFGPAPAVGWSEVLTQSALTHSLDMASKGFFAHKGSDGSSSYDRIARVGYPTRYTAEILALTPSSDPGKVIRNSMEAWLASPGHCRALMDPKLRDMGAACVSAGKSGYFSVNFGG